jgi:hypothetical protein
MIPTTPLTSSIKRLFTILLYVRARYLESSKRPAYHLLAPESRVEIGIPLQRNVMTARLKLHRKEITVLNPRDFAISLLLTSDVEPDELDRAGVAALVKRQLASLERHRPEHTHPWAMRQRRAFLAVVPPGGRRTSNTAH